MKDGPERDGDGSSSPSVLGIGLPYFARLPPDLYHPDVVDFVEVTPETLCREHADGGRRPSLRLLPQQFARARRACGDLPIVIHGVELSIGSAHGWNAAYLEMLDDFQAAWPFCWHSEHLGFQTVAAGGRVLNVGVPLPLPFTGEAARLVANRCSAILQRYRVPFLLENAAYYLADLPADPDVVDQEGLLRHIMRVSGCGQLLDLHNLHCNAVNLGLDERRSIANTDLERVIEIHVAGGSWSDGYLMDAHDGCVPERVWELLDETLPRAPNVAGVVFELLEEHAVTLGVERIVEQLDRARTIWRRHARPMALA